MLCVTLHACVHVQVLYAAVDTVGRLLNDDQELTEDKLASLYISLSSVVARDEARLPEALSLGKQLTHKLLS